MDYVLIMLHNGDVIVFKVSQTNLSTLPEGGRYRAKLYLQGTMGELSSYII